MRAQLHGDGCPAVMRFFIFNPTLEEAVLGLVTLLWQPFLRCPLPGPFPILGWVTLARFSWPTGARRSGELTPAVPGVMSCTQQ